jgi:hypothetical protein
MIPGGRKLRFDYHWVEVGAHRFGAASGMEEVARSPGVRISGNFTPTVHPETTSINVAYFCQPSDLRGPLQIRWTTTGSLANAQSGLVTLPVTAREVGAEIRHRISVVVEDADHLRAEDSREIVIRVVAPPPEDRPNPHLPGHDDPRSPLRPRPQRDPLR